MLGGRPRKLIDAVLEADWSPDGTRVAFVRMTSEDGDNAFYAGIAEVHLGHLALPCPMDPDRSGQGRRIVSVLRGSAVSPVPERSPR